MARGGWLNGEDGNVGCRARREREGMDRSVCSLFVFRVLCVLRLNTTRQLEASSAQELGTRATVAPPFPFWPCWASRDADWIIRLQPLATRIEAAQSNEFPERCRPQGERPVLGRVINTSRSDKLQRNDIQCNDIATVLVI